MGAVRRPRTDVPSLINVRHLETCRLVESCRQSLSRGQSRATARKTPSRCRVAGEGIGDGESLAEAASRRCLVAFVAHRPLILGLLGALNLCSHRATNCCHVIFDEALQTSGKNGLDRFAACNSLGVSGRAADDAVSAQSRTTVIPSAAHTCSRSVPRSSFTISYTEPDARPSRPR